jgi:hypothetical protein
MRNTRTYRTCWDCLPAEMQRKVVESLHQPLADLAQQAHTCRLFGSNYKERCAAEEDWLTSTTYSFWGHDLVKTLLLHLTMPPRAWGKGGNKDFYLWQGDWPSPEELLTLNRTYLHFQKPSEPPTAAASRDSAWCLYSHYDYDSGASNGDTDIQVIFRFRGAEVLPFIRFTQEPASTPALPLLGLAVLVCRKLEERLAQLPRERRMQLQRAAKPEGPFMRWDFIAWGWQGLKWHQVGWLPDDVKRAMDALTMAIWNCGSSLTTFTLVWYVGSPGTYGSAL